jgi:hypothetical protein
MKKTIAAVISAYPGLALDTVAVQRERPSDTAADINLGFSYFFH